MLRFTIRDLLWLMVVVGLLCALGLSTLYASRCRSEAASYRQLAENRKEQLRLMFDEWQRQKPKSIKHTDEGKYIIKPEDGPSLTIKP
jgi:hypothetical protein